MTTLAFTFVVPVRNDARRLDVALRSIQSAARPGVTAEIVVVDNGSTDDSASIARSRGAVVLDRPGVPVAVLRNEGARLAKGDVVAFIDADNELDPGWIEAAAGVFADPDVAAAGAPYSPPSDANRVQRTYDALRDRRQGRFPVEWLGSGNLAVRRDAFLAVGGFDEGLVTCEDVDLCRRLRLRGYRLVGDGRMRSVHHGDPRTLRAVFWGELWRGRDNVRVTFRRPRSLRSLLSLGMSVGLLLAVVCLAGGLVLQSWPFVALGGTLAAAIVLLRTARLLRALPAGVGAIRDAFAVASAYELGRAFALVARLSHHRAHDLRSSPAHV